MSLRATLKAVMRRKGTMFPLATTVTGSAKDRDEAMWNGAVRTLATKRTPWGVTEGATISGEDEARRMSTLRAAGRHGAPLSPEDHAHFATAGPYVEIPVDPHKIHAQYDGGSAPDEDQQKVIDSYAARSTPMPAVTASAASGTIVVQDGNHRVMAARKRGDATIAVRLPQAHLSKIRESALTAFGDEPAPGTPTLDTQLAPTGPGSVRPSGPDMAAAIQQRMWQKKQQQASGIRVDAANSAAIARDNQPPETSTANPGASLQMPPDLR